MYQKFLSAVACLAIVLTVSLLGFAQASTEKSSKSANPKTDMSLDMSRDTSQISKSSDKGKSGQLSSADKQFVVKAAEGGEAEVQLGELAQQKSQDPKVKEFAQRMVNDHSKANDQLKSLASNKGVTLPSEPDAKEKAEKNRLSKLSGEQFDRAYIDHMVKDHVKDVSEFRKEAQSAKDPDVKQFASSTLPTLEEHLKQAKSIAPKERAEAGSSKTQASSDKNDKTGNTSKGGNRSTTASNPPQQ
jgi:putative membrane protein